MEEDASCMYDTRKLEQLGLLKGTIQQQKKDRLKNLSN
jgi:hypothetical protein